METFRLRGRVDPGGDRPRKSSREWKRWTFWLPPMEELPPRAVRRAHGKGAIEEGIYNHPVLVVSRPLDENHVVHFHIVSLPKPFRRNNTYHHIRSHLFKANASTRYTPNPTNSTPAADHGICPYRHLQTTQMQAPRRPGSVSQLLTSREEQLSDGIPTLTYDMSTRSSGRT
jgi:hypothetical protein